jgi:16S rRNA (cytosine967-C5)-methyltransferase
MLEMAPGCLLVACDIHPARLRLVEQLASSSAARRPLYVALDGTRPLPICLAFHRILLDAPCSGTGTIRRNPEIKWRLKGSDLPLLAAKQRRLLSNALDALLIGGRLVYATCSIEPEENQEVVKQALEGRPEFSAVSIGRLPLDFLTREGANLLGGQWYFSTLPDQGLDGFFAAVIERTA